MMEEISKEKRLKLKNKYIVDDSTYEQEITMEKAEEYILYLSASHK